MCCVTVSFHNLFLRVPTVVAIVPVTRVRAVSILAWDSTVMYFRYGPTVVRPG